MKKVIARRGRVRVVVPVPPYLLHGLPCIVCQEPARAWYPGRYVDHDGRRMCRLRPGEQQAAAA